MQVQEVDKFLAEYKKDKELWIKVTAMMREILIDSVNELKDVKYKFTDPSQLNNDVIKEILVEQGFKYIVSVMDTIVGFDFKTMVSFVDLINQLKGTRKGLELVLKLMGFDSIIVEWWEQVPKAEPWTYEIIIIVDNSYVPDIFSTLNYVKEFSDNYVIAKVGNIDVRFSSPEFAITVPLLGGFFTGHYTGRALQRLNP